MGGYVLQRKDFKYRNAISFYIYFTTLFGGGLIPWYILMTKYLGLKDTYRVLIIPGLMSPFLIILMKNFMKSIPEEIVESAKVDGAGDFKIYASLVMPLAKPALATIGLFLALAYWNDWFISSIFITSAKKFSLQYVLYQILQTSEFFRSGASANVDTNYNLPTESIKLATAVIATGPVILFYPFVQKYFVQGLTVGAVKG
jgi:putative aldouronate transport system permease protein